MTTETQPPDPAQPKLEDIEQYRMQMAGISTAAIGYWKEGDSIHPDYDTVALRDVARLYAKYDALYKAAAIPAPEGADWTDVRMELEASGRADLSAWVASKLAAPAPQAAPATVKDSLTAQSPAEGDAGLTDEQAEAIAAFYDVSPGTVHDIYALSKPKAASDTQPKGMCRVRAASQPCDCPVATCNLWRGGLRPADAAEKLRAAHDESLDDKHQSCRSMLLEVVADLEKAPAPSPAPAMHSTALAGLILTHLGYSTEPSLEPGADMRRDALARRLDEWLSPATPCAAPAQCTPALKRHALEAADRLAMYAAAPFFPDTEKRGVKRATTAEWWDGLAELIEEAQPLIKRGLHECTAPLADLQAPAVGADHVADASKLVPFAEAEVERLYRNSYESTVSFAAFRRIVRIAEGAHRIGEAQPPVHSTGEQQ